MGFMDKFIPKDDRYSQVSNLQIKVSQLISNPRFAALLLYSMVFSTCFNGYDAGIMTVILADEQFIHYYGIDSSKSGLVATIPWAMTGSYLASP